MEGLEEVTVSTTCTNDMKMQRMVCGKTLKGELPHTGDTVHIDTMKAEGVPGVYYIAK